MIPRIKTVTALDDYMLRIVFDDGEIMLYDVKDDIAHIKAFKELETEEGLWGKVRLDTSRTCVYWNDRIDLPCRIARSIHRHERCSEHARIAHDHVVDAPADMLLERPLQRLARAAHL